MANLIGEPFEDYVSKQIDIRQKTHGSGMGGVSRTPQQLSYLNSKTAWVKLASGVYVSKEKIKKLGFSENKSGKELAKNFVLQGGVARIDKNGKPNFRGVNPDGKTRNGVFDFYTGPYNVNPAFQNSGLEFGLVPMPGIENVEVKFMNRGSIKRATVKIKAYNKTQFDVIDALYLRLGYTVLLEWGNGMYLDNGGNLITNYSTLIDNSSGWFSGEFAKKSTTQILKSINDYRKGKDGNYDAMYAKVTNFTWSFNKDGSYDIELKLISHGDIIESLKFNTTPNPLFSKQLNMVLKIFKYNAGEDDGEDADQAGADEPNPMDNIISAYLFLQKIYVYNGYNTGIKNYFNNHDIEYKDPTGGDNGNRRIGIFVVQPKDGSVDVNVDVAGFSLAYNLKFEDIGKPKKKDIVYMNYVEEDDRAIHGKGFYMRFGHFLEFIQKNCMPVIQPKGGSEKEAYPILNIDYQQWDENRMLYYPNQTSLDPRVCIVNSYVGRYKIFNSLIDWTEHEKNNINSDKHRGYAWTMNIYLNHDLIQNSIINNLDEQGNVAFFPMLSSICSELNKALGGINNLEPVIDEETSTLKIIDSSYSQDEVILKSGIIETFGYNNTSNTSNFVRDIDLKTEITKEYADMITIGATAGGYVKGTEATAFSKWSEGFVDRFKEKVTPPKNNAIKEVKSEAALNYFQNYYNTGIDLMLGYKYIDVDDDVTSNDAPQLQDDVIDNNVAIVTEYYKYLNEKAREKTKDEKDPKKQFSSKINGFIPFNLGLTLDGISGIKIYNKLDVDTSFLPQNYPDALQFIIKGVNHKLSNDDWETQLETQTIPASLDNKQSFQTLFNIVDKQTKIFEKKVKYLPIKDNRPKTKDGEGSNNYDAGDNPKYTPSSPYTPVKTAPAGWDGLSTLTSGFPMKKTQYSTRSYQKTQIYLHYTAGHQKSNKGKSSANSLYGSGLSCHAIVDIDGHIERMIPDEYTSYCQGKSDRKAGDIYPNRVGLSVEIQALGYERGTGKNPDFNAYGKGQPLVGCVDWQGNPIPEYRGHKRYQEFSDAQMGAVKELCLDWLKNHNIAFEWSKEHYDDMFPPKNKTSRNVFGNKPGIWSHNSVKRGKSDVQPSPKMIKMLKEISDIVNGPTKEELAAQAAALAKKHAAYNARMKKYADLLYYSMDGGGTYINVFNKVVNENTAEQRKDIAVYFDSFARSETFKSQNPKDAYKFKSQFRLSQKEVNSTKPAKKGSRVGRWGGSNGMNYTKEKGQAPLRNKNDNRYEGYTLYEWIAGEDAFDLIRSTVLGYFGIK